MGCSGNAAAPGDTQAPGFGRVHRRLRFQVRRRFWLVSLATTNDGIGWIVFDDNEEESLLPIEEWEKRGDRPLQLRHGPDGLPHRRLTVARERPPSSEDSPPSSVQALVYGN